VAAAVSVGLGSPSQSPEALFGRGVLAGIIGVLSQPNSKNNNPTLTDESYGKSLRMNRGLVRLVLPRRGGPMINPQANCVLTRLSVPISA
jgi:hypothetical protein